MTVTLPVTPSPVGLQVAGGLSFQQSESATYLGLANTQVTNTFLYADNYTSWSDAANSYYMTQVEPTSVLVVSTPLCMSGENLTGTTSIAAGSYDTQIQAMGNMVIANGGANAILRIGWEPDGDSYPWATQGAAAYVSAFQHMVTVLRALSGANFLIDWNGAGTLSTGASPTSAWYPGDSYVDVISDDAYDNITWANRLATLTAMVSFAGTHSKHYGITEWGLRTTSNDGQGDDPTYIQHMHDWMAANPPAYAIYYDRDDSVLSSWPNSAALFKTLFAGGVVVIPGPITAAGSYISAGGSTFVGLSEQVNVGGTFLGVTGYQVVAGILTAQLATH
jgi:hypothetical protein